MAKEQHVALLRSGSEVWNAWRAKNPRIKPSLKGANLSDANLSRTDLSSADLSRANLAQANLSGAGLVDAKLSHANLTSADLSGADLSGAVLTGADASGAILKRANLSGAICDAVNFSDANLSKAILRGALLMSADLTDANLRNAELPEADLSQSSLVFTDLRDSKLDGCRVFGVAAWEVKLDGASQIGLVITPFLSDEPDITVDDLEVAQFIYMLLNNKRLRAVIDTITAKVVLVLGRFTPKRKAVLDAMHSELRRCGYSPIVFEYTKPRNRSTTETVLTLAAMARFVVADLTDAASVQQELSAIALSPITSVPVQPVLLQGSPEWSMFVDLQLKGPFLDPYIYDSTAQLIGALSERVISPADQKAQELQREMEQRYARAAARRVVR